MLRKNFEISKCNSTIKTRNENEFIRKQTRRLDKKIVQKPTTLFCVLFYFSLLKLMYIQFAFTAFAKDMINLKSFSIFPARGKTQTRT